MGRSCQPRADDRIKADNWHGAGGVRNDLWVGRSENRLQSGNATDFKGSREGKYDRVCG
jgi:hypothetical protein